MDDGKGYRVKVFQMACFVAVTATPICAQTLRDAEAHVHGVSTAQIAVEGAYLEITLRSPGMDIVGFEHPARSERDKAAVEAAVRRFLTPEAIITLPAAAGCRLSERLVQAPGAEDGAHAEDHDADHVGHSEFFARYGFVCDSPAELSAVDFPFFDSFENAAEIEVQFVTEAGAGAVEVRRSTPRLALE